VPAQGGRTLPTPVTHVAEVLYGEVEDDRVTVNLSALRHPPKLAAPNALDARRGPEPDGTAVEQPHVQLPFEPLYILHERVDRAAGSGGAILVYRYEQEAVVLPLERDGERPGVRRPFLEEPLRAGDQRSTGRESLIRSRPQFQRLEHAAPKSHAEPKRRRSFRSRSPRWRSDSRRRSRSPGSCCDSL